MVTTTTTTTRDRHDPRKRRAARAAISATVSNRSVTKKHEVMPPINIKLEKPKVLIIEKPKAVKTWFDTHYRCKSDGCTFIWRISEWSTHTQKKRIRTSTITAPKGTWTNLTDPMREHLMTFATYIRWLHEATKHEHHEPAANLDRSA